LFDEIGLLFDEIGIRDNKKATDCRGPNACAMKKPPSQNKNEELFF
jgi:hypothetical protein